MSKTIFEKREQAFESVFFARLDKQLIQDLRARRERVIATDLLTDSSGISDPALLEHLLDIGIDAANIQAISLVPLASTAWPAAR